MRAFVCPGDWLAGGYFWRTSDGPGVGTCYSPSYVPRSLEVVFATAFKKNKDTKYLLPNSSL